MKFEQIRRPTLMMVGMDARIAPAVLRAFVESAARIVCIGTSTQETCAVVRSACKPVHWLDLDILNARHRAALHAHWEDEALDLVVHLQALCHPQDPDRVTRSILEITHALARGLKAVHGGCVCLLPEETGAGAGFDPALGRAFDTSGIAFSAVRAPSEDCAQERTDALVRLLHHAL